MATCGYICPVCEGNGYTDDGKDCAYCNTGNDQFRKQISNEEWLDRVHNSCSCSDIGSAESASEQE